MKRVSANVYVESGFVACNVAFVTTKEGIVAIDTPMRPTEAMQWRDEISKRGQLRYLINTEEHADHWLSSWIFGGVLVTSQETRDKLSRISVEEAVEKVRRMDPNELPHMKSFNLRLADISFTGSLNLYLGDHSFRLFPLVGHSTGGIGVYIPEERVVFATDCIFHHLKTWLPEAIPDQWLESLEKLGGLDVDVIVPGHGDICNKDYLREQANIIKQWVAVVQAAIEQGISEEEAIAKISQPDPYPKQPNTPGTEPELNRKNIARLYQIYSK